MNEIKEYLKNEEFVKWTTKRRWTNSIYWDVKRYENNLNLVSDINLFEFKEIIGIFKVL